MFFFSSLWIDQIFFSNGLLTIFMICYTPHHRGSVRFPFGLGSLQSQYVQASNLRGRYVVRYCSRENGQEDPDARRVSFFLFFFFDTRAGANRQDTFIQLFSRQRL